MKYRLSGGTLINDNKTLQKDLLFADGRIIGLVDRDEKTDGYSVVDVTGLYVSAGFVDIHQHGGGGADYMDDDPDVYFKATEAHLRHGTTSVMPTLMSSTRDDLSVAIKRYVGALSDKRIRANLLGLFVEGPYISPEQSGAMRPDRIRAFDPEEYREMVDLSEGNIRRITAAPELDGAEQFAEFAKKENITLSIGHSNADLDTVLRAYDLGYRHITHLYSCMSTITRRGGFRVAGVLEAAYYIDDMDVEIIADGCHVPTSLLEYVAKFKDHSRISLITDAMRAAGQDVSESYLGAGDSITPVIIEDGVAKLVDRSAFGGSVATSDRLVRNMLLAGVSLPSAIMMITENPIRQMGLKVKKGRLEVGYDADICVFDGDINLKHVICNGEFVF
ncbi:MAG: N-acetylglucosamine-6-phosphate deacetylase [Clostridia bacterium]|nr:N-acetylglucosamine-6-phosphate deacetylase [Clostridia bacterium]